MVRHMREEDAIADAVRAIRRSERDGQRPTGTEKALTTAVAATALERVEEIETAREDEQALAALVPKAPIGLNIISNVGAFTVAGPIATVTVDWDPVEESTDDEPISVAEYGFWDGDAPLMRVPASSAVFTIPSGLSTEIRVLARTPAGVAGDLSAPLAVTGAAPSVADRDPSTPTLISGSSNVVARWDGTYTGGGTTGAHAVWVEASLDEIGWVRQGAALTGAGSTPVRLGGVDDTVYVRLAAYDQLGRLTGLSSTASIVVVGIDGDDIIAGTIEGNRLVAGSLEVDILAPNVGETLNIFANEAVQVIVGRQDSQDTAIAGAQQTADQAGADALDAATTAGAAGAAAAVADGKALVAQTMAQSTQDQLTAHQAVFRVTPTGAEVASVDGSNVLALTPTGVQIIQGGTPASTWDAGRLIVNEAIVNRAQIGAHSFEKYSPQRTIIRPI